MRSGWPSSQDDPGRHSVDHRQVPYGPEVSWPGGGYASSGEDPYAAYNAVGYGDPGYSDPGYNGPSAQDAGVPGTRTVRGFVDPSQGTGPRALPASPNYPAPGYAAPQDYPAPDYGPGYGQSAGYSQPWDYSQPLRYDGDDLSYPGPGHPSGPYPIQGGYDAPGRPAPAYDPAGYNGSELSRPGIDGPGYDLSGIIGTSDFPAFGYDEPSVERLSYDD